MKYSDDITIFNSFIQRQRIYQFLAGVKEDVDKERRDLLNQESLPTVEMAYAMIRREITRRGIMGTTSSLGTGPSEIGKGLAIKNQSKTSFRREDGDRSHLKCTHYGGTKHTKEGCFKLIGYPDRLEENKHRRTAIKASGSRTGGKVHLVTNFPGDRQSPHEPTTKSQSMTGIKYNNAPAGIMEKKSLEETLKIAKNKNIEREAAGLGEKGGMGSIQK